MKTYSSYLSEFFPGIKVQKISINTGGTCPNRDGSIGTGGCLYCRNDAFTPGYCMENESIREQIEKGKSFFQKKYKEMKYLVYLQSYTSTYALNSEFQKICEECIKSKNVVGLIVGSRPDTLSDEKISFLSDISRESPVFLEIGAETSNNDTLKMINRHHTWEEVVTVVEKAARNNLHCGLHLIAGLPGEDEDQVIRNVSLACDLPIETLKLHQLQILYGTRLYDMWKEGSPEIKIYEFEEYLRLCVKLVSIIPDNIVIDRFISQSPPDLVAAPKWGVKNYQFMEILNKTITSKNSFLR